MATWIFRLDEPGDGPRLAVKDLIDVAGTPTTAGCAGVADIARPAGADAPCITAARRAGARITGKVNLHELAFGGTGENPWYGTPVNPLDPTRWPGGSSSGCAVAVATGEADVAFGTDTAGSVRTPSACCGTTGLKTTWGRVSLEGVWPLAPTLDTVGPMAADIAGVVTGMQLLEPGFAPATAPAACIGRIRLDGVDPIVDRAVDELLAESGIDVIEVHVEGWHTAIDHAVTVLFGEAWLSDGGVYERDPSRIGDSVRTRLEQGKLIAHEALDEARAARGPWRAELARAFEQAPVLALPTLRTLAPSLDDPSPDTRTTNAPLNLAGHPALALPAPTGGPLPASVQLIGPDGSEELLVATGAVLEGAARA